MKQIIVEKNIPVNNNELADKNRKLLDEKQIFTINLLGSPGSGKTCLLEKLIENIKTNYNMAVILCPRFFTRNLCFASFPQALFGI